MFVCVCCGAGFSAGGSPRVPEAVREAVQRGEEDHRGELHSRGGSEGERVRAFKGQQYLRWSCDVRLLDTKEEKDLFIFCTLERKCLSHAFWVSDFHSKDIFYAQTGDRLKENLNK